MTSTGAAEQRARDGLPELDRLELALRRLLDRHEVLRQRAEQAETRARELEQALSGIQAGHIDPVELRTRAERLEAENTALRERLREVDAVAQRIQARLQFVEEER
jgi:DNA repair exonuclease SbcCD ATPase subunit